MKAAAFITLLILIIVVAALLGAVHPMPGSVDQY